MPVFLFNAQLKLLNFSFCLFLSLTRRSLFSSSLGGFHLGSIYFRIEVISWVPFTTFIYRGSIWVPFGSISKIVVGFHLQLLFRGGSIWVPFTSRSKIVVGFHSLIIYIGVPFGSRSKLVVGFHLLFLCNFVYNSTLTRPKQWCLVEVALSLSCWETSNLEMRL